jgi:hypothetical protein
MTQISFHLERKKNIISIDESERRKKENKVNCHFFFGAGYGKR